MPAGLVSILILLGIAGTGQGDKAATPKCRPMWAQLSKAPLSVHSGVHEARFSAIVIGCEEAIAGLGADKMKVVEEKVMILSICALTSMIILSFLPGRKWACKPSFLELSSQEISVNAGAIQFGLRAALIGCSRDLQAIQPAEIEAVHPVIASTVREFGWRFLNTSHDQELRELLVDRINRQLNRKAVTDILVYSFSFSE